jgi:hypothetical protein
MTQAAISALLVVTLQPSAFPNRLLDALAGGAVGLVVNAVVPAPRPLATLRRTLRTLAEHAAGAIDEAAGALRAGSVQAALEALRRARAADAGVPDARRAAAEAQEAVRIAGRVRLGPSPIDRHAEVVEGVVVAAQACRGLCRLSVAVLRRDPTPRPGLAAGLTELADAVRALPAAADDAQARERVRTGAARAVARATRGWAESPGVRTAGLLALMRTVAHDVDLAAGLTHGQARAALDDAAGRTAAAQGPARQPR